MGENPIYFKTSDGAVTQLDVNPSVEVQYICEWVRDVLCIPDTKAITLQYNGQNLGNEMIFGDVVPKNAEVLVKVSVVAPSDSAKRRSKRGLPQRDVVKQPAADPDDFNQKVAALMEMAEGRAPEHELRTRCEEALRMAFYNMDRASAYVLSGHIPDTRRPEVEKNTKGEDWASQYRQEERDFINSFHEEFPDIPLSVVVQICAGCEFQEEASRENLEAERAGMA